MSKDYEKKYNDLVNDLKELWNCHTNDSQLLGELAEICPELVDSGDERIRKELVNFLQSPFIKENLTDEKVAPWVAYLEKQKENPKSADSIPSDCVSDAKCEDKSPKHSDSDGTDIRDTPAYWKGWDDAMKQKEQKHPNGCFTCDEYKKGYESGRLNGFTAGYNKAMKEIDQKEQKPAEWNEEDERIITALTKALIGSDSAEKIMLFDGVTIEMVSDWLKSLRPSWKPSEEQEEPDKSLEEEVKNYFQGYWPGTETVEQCNTDLHFTPPAIIRLARHFAEWQKSQMLKDAVEGYVNYYEDSGGILMAEAQVGCPYHNGDKVRLIVLKAEEE